MKMLAASVKLTFLLPSTVTCDKLRNRVVRGPGSWTVVQAQPPRLALTVMSNAALAAGLDFGTSAARLSVIVRATSEEVWFQSRSLAQQSVLDWCNALRALSDSVPEDLASQISAVAVDGTSASCVGLPSHSVQMYYETGNPEALRIIREAGPAGHVASSASSSLAKLLSWTVSSEHQTDDTVFAHQVDCLQMMLIHGPRWQEAAKTLG